MLRSRRVTPDDGGGSLEPMNFSRILRRVYPLLPFLLAAALLALLFVRVDAGAVQEELENAKLIWLPLIFGSSLVSDWFRALRWRYLLLPMKPTSAPVLFAASQIGSAVNLLLPLRAGEAVRVQIVRQRTGLSPSSIVGTFLLEVVSDLAAFAIIIIAGLLLFESVAFLWPLAVVAVLLVIGGLAGARYLAGRAEQWDPPATVAFRASPFAWTSRELYHFAHGLRSLRDPVATFHVLWTAHAIWLCEAIMFYACGRALSLDVSPAAYPLLMVAANVAGSVPLTQSGFGFFEVTLTGLAVALGIGEAEAAAYAVFVHILLTAPHVISGPLAAAALRLTPGEIFSRGDQSTTEIK